MLATAAGAVLASRHPLAPFAALLGFALWCAAAARWRGLWLFVVPAALPLANLAPWTGWLAFDEFDLVVLGAVAGGYARLARDARRGSAAVARRSRGSAPLSRVDAALLAVLAALGAVAFLRGVADAGGGPLDPFLDHDGPLEAWRVFKPLPWALLLAPLAWRDFGAAPAAAGRRLGDGMLAGLAVVSLAVLWERAAYPGLADWSDPYRVTALFWEMHVGGAAIDAHLVLSMPFLAWTLARAPSSWRWAVSALLAVLATHACLATYARGVYGAVGVSLALLAAAHAWQRRPGGAGAPAPPWRARANALLALVLAAECAAALVAGSFVRERAAEIPADFGGRLAHWRRGIALLETPAQWLLGIGTGRLPEHYMQAADGHERPGAVRLVATEDGRPAVRVSGPAREPQLGGLYALTQRVAPGPGMRRVALEVRASRDADIAVQVCERHLLYPRRCDGVDLRVTAGDGGWQRLAATLESGPADRGRAPVPRLGMFSLFVATPGAAVELRRVGLSGAGLSGAGGEALLANGDFAAGMARWFPVAQAYFLPWHVDSLWLELLIERGALSLALFALLALHALRRLWAAGARGCGGVALPVGAALAGVLLLGVVSSVLDMPRVALPVWLALVVPLRRPAATGPAFPGPGRRAIGDA